MSEAAVEVDGEAKEDRIKVVVDCTIKPKSEFILVVVDPEEEELTVGGIIVPESALQNKKTVTGTVIAVGPGRFDYNNWDAKTESYRRIPIDCEAGDRIFCAAFIGYPVMINGVEHIVIKHNDLMGNYEETVETLTVEEVRARDLMTNDRIRVI